jgi:hypothetical protein
MVVEPSLQYLHFMIIGDCAGHFRAINKSRQVSLPGTWHSALALGWNPRNARNLVCDSADGLLQDCSSWLIDCRGGVAVDRLTSKIRLAKVSQEPIPEDSVGSHHDSFVNSWVFRRGCLGLAK